MESNSRLLSVRIPDSLYRAIELRADKEKKTIPEVTRNALELFFFHEAIGIRAQDIGPYMPKSIEDVSRHEVVMNELIRHYERAEKSNQFILNGLTKYRDWFFEWKKGAIESLEKGISDFMKG